MQVNDILYTVSNFMGKWRIVKVKIIRFEFENKNICRVQTINDHPSDYYIALNDNYWPTLREAVYHRHKKLYDGYMNDIEQLKSLEEKYEL